MKSNRCLGNGARLAAVRDGKSVDISMGFTRRVPMSTRSGDLDRGLVLYLARTEQRARSKFNEMVDFHSGLLGICETSFAGGIGENAPMVRARICEGLEFLGIELEEKQNASNGAVISTAASWVAVHVIHTDEEYMIAKTVCCVLGLEKKGKLSHENEHTHA